MSGKCSDCGASPCDCEQRIWNARTRNKNGHDDWAKGIGFGQPAVMTRADAVEYCSRLSVTCIGPIQRITEPPFDFDASPVKTKRQIGVGCPHFLDDSECRCWAVWGTSASWSGYVARDGTIVFNAETADRVASFMSRDMVRTKVLYNKDLYSIRALVAACGHPQDSRDCTCWGVWYEGPMRTGWQEHRLAPGLPWVPMVFNLYQASEFACGGSTSTEKYSIRLLDIHTSNPVDDVVQKPHHTCALSFCGKKFADRVGEFCSTNCANTAESKATIEKRHDEFVQRVSKIGSFKTTSWLVGIESEKAWSAQKTHEAIESLRASWHAVQHDEPLGDPRHFATLDDDE